MTLLALRVAAQYTQDVLLATAAQSAVWRVRAAVTDRLLALDLPTPADQTSTLHHILRGVLTFVQRIAWNV